MNDRLQRFLPWGITLLFATMYALLVFGNHLCFRTYCLDLGVYTHTLYDYAHLRVDDCSSYLWEPQSALGDHFDLYLPMLSPLVFLFGQYTLLLVQILAVLFGGWGVYLLIKENTDSQLLPPLAMVALLGSFGVWHALGFDYHSSVVASMLMPWFWLCFQRGRYGWSSALIFLIAIAKETMPLWIFCVALALLWDYRRDRVARRWLLGYMGFAVVYFVVIAMMAMPSLGSNSQVIWRYKYMGDSFGDIARWIVCHPGQAVVNCFSNFTHDPGDQCIKLEFWLCIAASGGLVLLLRRPHWLLMMVPCVLMKMLARDAGFWGITFQYNAELMPVLVCGSFLALSQMRPRWLAPALTLLVLLTTVYSVSNPRTHIRKANLRIHAADHYRQREFSAAEARRMLALIPPDASVCATTMFEPHLAARDSVYMFPIGLGHNAEYYLLLDHH